MTVLVLIKGSLLTSAFAQLVTVLNAVEYSMVSVTLVDATLPSLQVILVLRPLKAGIGEELMA